MNLFTLGLGRALHTGCGFPGLNWRKRCPYVVVGLALLARLSLSRLHGLWRGGIEVHVEDAELGPLQSGVKKLVGPFICSINTDVKPRHPVHRKHSAEGH